jgi:PPOX class probable F420-dependent enzyme
VSPHPPSVGLEAPSTRSVDPEIAAFLDVPRFAVVATLRPDGSAHQAVVWYLFDGAVVTINSAPHRRWPSDLRRDPRISVMVEDGASYVALYGSVEIDDDQDRAQADIAAMARRYHPEEPARVDRMIRTQFRRQTRVSFRFVPERVHAILEGED